MILQINLVDVPVSPSTFEVSTYDILNEESTIRTASGKMHIDRIAVKRKIDITWALLTAAQAQQILTLLQYVTVILSFEDPQTNAIVLKDVKVSDKTLSRAFTKNGTTYYESLSVSFDEL